MPILNLPTRLDQFLCRLQKLIWLLIAVLVLTCALKHAHNLFTNHAAIQAIPATLKAVQV